MRSHQKDTAASLGTRLGARAAQIAESLRASLWFLPAVMVLTAGFLALALVEIDREASDKLLASMPWLYQGGAEGARGVLASIASSMVSVVGVTFSITIVALVLASTQYTPRLLRNFTSDRGNQVVLGGFLATFTYALLVLRTVRGEDYQPFVPQLAVTVGVLLALGCLGLFVYFIHHIAHSIQASTLISKVTAETAELIDRLFPEKLGEPVSEAPADLPMAQPGVVAAPMSGYLQVIDAESLMRTACAADVLLRVERVPGQFVTEEEPLVSVWPAEAVTKELERRLVRAFGVGRDRTMQQDPAFGFRQLVDIAVKALSPGINDPTTAVTCVDHLGSLLHRLSGRAIPSPYRRDDHGRLRVIAAGPTFAGMVELAFREIRQYGADSVSILARLVETLTVVARANRDPDRKEILWRTLEQVAETADAHVCDRYDRIDVNGRCQEAAAALGRDPSPLLLRSRSNPRDSTD